MTLLVRMLIEARERRSRLCGGINPRLMFITNPLGNFFDLLSLINSAVNFVLCALMSHVFRREFLHTFSMCCPQSSENHSGAPITKSSNRTVLGDPLNY
ncbi:unnamed protein product [Nippostrongylus brasiliensis]|uniref:G_PROTEIN_RECEP_F1_2 domain-containing protein n=1 Tax=Nippostrongylus brasiliensis TaxID=27835 RepID=A0A0N4XC63_NIPBR|nr:unnamed protein product [Nippostrongylus brasiliensis]